MGNKKSIYFDCKTGISGDMVLGALVDLGVSAETLEKELSRLGLGNFHLEVKQEEKYGQKGSNVYFYHHDHNNDGHNNHDHNDHGHQNHGHQHNHHGHVHEDHQRSFREIEALILSSSLKEPVKNKAIAIYLAIAEAESTVHETDIDHVHFHEVGRDVAMLNIVGAAICMDMLEIDQVFCSELHDGQGFIQCSHGTIPVPVPAVQAMLEGTGFRLIQDEFNTEMVTPTGLGILKGLGAMCLEDAQFTASVTVQQETTAQTENTALVPIKAGHGFGKKDAGRLSVLSAYLLDKS